MISLRTNVDSLNAQMNLKLNSNFESKTIQQLTSGYRINQSGDDAAGLAIANAYRSNTAELNQGVANANDGVGQLQIVDGGLSNISTLLDRMKTLATQSASGTFTGDRGTLNAEYSQLVSEITRQASNINLNSGGSLNKALNVYIGGANSSSTAGISIDLSGNQNAVDAGSLGLSATTVTGGATDLTGNTLSLTTAGASFVKGVAGTNDQTFSLNYVDNTGTAQAKTLTVAASTNGSTLNQVLSSLNSQLNGTGIQAGTDVNGYLEFTGSSTFAVKDLGATAGTALITSNSASHLTSANAANYSVASGGTYSAITAGTDTLNFTLSSGASVSVALGSVNGATQATAITAINSATSAYGITAVADPSAAGGIIFQSANSFTLSDTTNAAFAGGGAFGTAASTTAAHTVSAPTATNGGANAQAAITAIDAAVKQLGLVQGVVGAGENKLQYAINLAQSQISSFSAAESQIRDADVAAQAANLTKAQVLQQTSIAAMAQANQEPQSVLKLLQ